MTARRQHPYEHHLSVATDTFKQLNHVLGSFREGNHKDRQQR